jgi:hypothetical protein
MICKSHNCWPWRGGVSTPLEVRVGDERTIVWEMGSWIRSVPEWPWPVVVVMCKLPRLGPNSRRVALWEGGKGTCVQLPNHQSWLPLASPFELPVHPLLPMVQRPLLPLPLPLRVSLRAIAASSGLNSSPPTPPPPTPPPPPPPPRAARPQSNDMNQSPAGTLESRLPVLPFGRGPPCGAWIASRCLRTAREIWEEGENNERQGQSVGRN